MDERRLLLAVALSLVVVITYSWLFAPPPPPPQSIPTPTLAAATPAAGTGAAGTPTAGSSVTGTTGPEASPTDASRSAQPTTPVERVADESERRVEVNGPDFEVAFTNRGARLVSWKLERYKDARGRPEELVPALSPALRPLDIETGDATIDARLRDALFKPSTTNLALRGEEPQSLSFVFREGELAAEKTLAFRAKGLVAITASVKKDGRELPSRLVWGPGLGTATAEERDVRGYTEPTAVALVGTKVTQFDPAKLEGARSIEGARWVGVESRYFAALLVAPGGGGGAWVRPATLPARPDEKPIKAAVAAIEATPGQGPVLLYVGAKEHDDLVKLGHGLERVVQAGEWIGPIVLALMGLLRWVHAHVGNWGWAIVLLTVVINLVMAPFRHFSIVNGLKMAKLAPEQRVIQERYRKVPLLDPRRQQMQEELSQVFAKHGVSQTSMLTVGCLPMLVTLPFLWAFYRVLTVLVDLRGADFLWIPDLAAKDPLFITPVLMGVSMFVMQKMTPSAMDPAQQKIMMLMPLMLVGMFLWAPAGLNLYWFTSNLWSVLQQWAEMTILRPKDLRPAKAVGRKSR